MSDPRLAWLGARVCASLGADSEAWDTLLRSEGGVPTHELVDWLDASGTRPALVFQVSQTLVEPEPESPVAPPPRKPAADFEDDGEEGDGPIADGAPAESDPAGDTPGGDGDDAAGALAGAPGAAAGAPLTDGPAAEPEDEEDAERQDAASDEPEKVKTPPEPYLVSTLHLAIGAARVQAALSERPTAEAISFSCTTEEPLHLDEEQDVDTFMVRARDRARRAARARARTAAPAAR